jgi:hypothetical protein
LRSSPAVAVEATTAWREFLVQELDCPVTVVYTRARKVPLRIRPFRTGPRGARRSGVEVRLHALFDEAPPEIRRAVASWIRSGERATRACRMLDDWVQQALAGLPPAPERAEAVRTRGEHRDLRALLDDVLHLDFAGEAELHARPPGITWGRRGASRSRGGLRLGSYDPDLHRIRIHPVMDQPAVPEWFVRYVVFHECLHARFPPRRGSDGRWIHHGPELQARERAYADHRRVLAWEKAHLKALVRSAKRGEPMRLGPVPVPRPSAPVPVGAPPAPSPTLLPRVVRVLQSLLFD